MNYPHFNGPDYSPKSDHARLTAQHERIKELMRDKKWRTLSEISKQTGDPEASISAQLRHLRKQRFGSHILEKRNRGERKSGLYEYRLLPPGSKSEFEYVPRRNRYREALMALWKDRDFTERQREIVRSIFN